MDRKHPNQKKPTVRAFEKKDPRFFDNMATRVQMEIWKANIPDLIREYKLGKTLSQIAGEYFGDEEGIDRSSLVGAIVKRLIHEGVLEHRPTTLEEQFGPVITARILELLKDKKLTNNEALAQINKEYPKAKITYSNIISLRVRFILSKRMQKVESRKHSDKVIARVQELSKTIGPRAAARKLRMSAGAVSGILTRNKTKK